MRRSVRSRVTLAKPMSAPSSPRSAVITTFAQNREPSLRTRHPSSSNRPSRPRDLELESGIPAGDVRIRIERGEVLADDLVGLVALDALRAFVPARDAPVGSSMKMA